MVDGSPAPPLDEPKGLRRFHLGAGFGLAGGIIGLVLPISVNLLVVYTAFGLLRVGTTLVALTSVLVLVGALLLAISLIFYRLGFSALRRFDRWFRSASILCNIGSVGLVLIIAAAALALYSSPALAACVQASPTQALNCLQSIQPLTAYSVVVGFWLAWLGGLGVVVGLELGGRRYRSRPLIAGGALYALLLLVLIDPFIALLFPVGGWQYPLLTAPILALVAPLYVYAGSHPSLPERKARRPRPVAYRDRPAPTQRRAENPRAGEGLPAPLH